MIFACPRCGLPTRFHCDHGGTEATAVPMDKRNAERLMSLWIDELTEKLNIHREAREELRKKE